MLFRIARYSCHGSVCFSASVTGVVLDVTLLAFALPDFARANVRGREAFKFLALAEQFNAPARGLLNNVGRVDICDTRCSTHERCRQVHESIDQTLTQSLPSLFDYYCIWSTVAASVAAAFAVRPSGDRSCALYNDLPQEAHFDFLDKNKGHEKERLNFTMLCSCEEDTVKCLPNLTARFRGSIHWRHILRVH